ncbi:MAG: hypothetical protein ACYCUI_15015 [Vulcanimicrobiaceae bacterium]
MELIRCIEIAGLKALEEEMINSGISQKSKVQNQLHGVEEMR